MTSFNMRTWFAMKITWKEIRRQGYENSEPITAFICYFRKQPTYSLLNIIDYLYKRLKKISTLPQPENSLHNLDVCPGSNIKILIKFIMTAYSNMDLPWPRFLQPFIGKTTISFLNSFSSIFWLRTRYLHNFDYIRSISFF